MATKESMGGLEALFTLVFYAALSIIGSFSSGYFFSAGWHARTPVERIQSE